MRVAVCSGLRYVRGWALSLGKTECSQRPVWLCAHSAPGVYGLRAAEREERIVSKRVFFARRDCAGCAVAMLALMVCLSQASAEQVLLEGPSQVFAGDSFSVLVKLTDNTTPLIAYAVDVSGSPMPGAVGSIFVDPFDSNFRDGTDNLITEGGGSLHPASDIIQLGSNRLYFFALNFDLSQTVDLATLGVNDVLGEVIFDVPLDALGNFELFFSPATTVLVGLDSVEVPYEMPLPTLNVEVLPVPEPALLGVLLAVSLFYRKPRRR